MSIILIVIYVICALSVLANWIVKKLMTKKITIAKTAKEAVRLRKKYRSLRLVNKILFGVLFVFGVIFLIIVVADSKLPIAVLQILLPTLVSTGLLVLASMSLPVSGKTIDDVDWNGFDLYLRGFSSDDLAGIANFQNVSNYDHHFSNREMNIESEYIEIRYEDAWGIRTRMKIEKPFSERLFYNAYKKASGRMMYCVGRPKELESPEGGIRVYLDDETWQENVARLIDRAEHVYVLVNASESCIWEILECKRVALNKTYFFIHSPEHLKALCENLQDSAPEILRNLLNENDESIKHTLAFERDGEKKVLRYVNTTKGFEDMFKELS